MTSWGLFTVHENSNKIPDNYNISNKRACLLCGRIIENKKAKEEIIDGDKYLFDSTIASPYLRN